LADCACVTATVGRTDAAAPTWGLTAAMRVAAIDTTTPAPDVTLGVGDALRVVAMVGLIITASMALTAGCNAVTTVAAVIGVTVAPELICGLFAIA